MQVKIPCDESAEYIAAEAELNNILQSRYVYQQIERI